jgi:hypothetical protein
MLILLWLLLLVAGFFLLRLSVSRASTSIHLKREGAAGPGHVTGSVTTTGKGGKTMYAPIVDFVTLAGEKITFQSSMYRPSPLPPGKPLTVLYQPANPHEARIDSFGELWGLPLVTFAGGLMLVVAGGVKLIRALHGHA